MKRLAFILAALLWAAPVAAQTTTFSIPPGSLYPPVLLIPASAVNGAGVVTSPQLLIPDGTVGAPGLAYILDTDSGLRRSGTNTVCFVTGGGDLLCGAANLTVQNGVHLLWATDNGTDIGASAASRPRTIYSGTSFIGPLFRSDSAKVLFQGTGTGATQMSATQTTVPTCSASCGTSPAVVGTDTFMKVTMGASGVPASPFTVTFNGTWAAAPACTVTSGLATMVVGKMAIAAPTTTTTVIITTNGTAPGNSDVYFIHCGGVQ